MDFKQYLSGTNEIIRSVETSAPLLSRWFVGGFMDGKRGNWPDLIDGFKKLRSLAPPPPDMTLFRVIPHEHTDQREMMVSLNPVTSWTERDTNARVFYRMISKAANSPVKNQPHIIIRKTFNSDEILLRTGDVIDPLNKILTYLDGQEGIEFPYRTSNLLNNIEYWYQYQKEVIINSPGMHKVEIYENLD